MVNKTLSEKIVDYVGTGRDPDELVALEGASGVVASGTPVANIAALTLTGTYGTDDNGIEDAINGILAALVAFGIMLPSA